MVGPVSWVGDAGSQDRPVIKGELKGDVMRSRAPSGVANLRPSFDDAELLVVGSGR